MLNIKKGFSLLESLVALFVLSMITLAYINSSTIFFKSQTDLIKSDRKDQLADLILQDIMEYVSQKNSSLGIVIWFEVLLHLGDVTVHVPGYRVLGTVYYGYCVLYGIIYNKQTPSH